MLRATVGSQPFEQRQEMPPAMLRNQFCTGAESSSSARAEMHQSSWTRSKNYDLIIHKRAGSGLPVRAGDQARSSNETVDAPNVQSQQMAKQSHTHDAVEAVKHEADVMHQLVVDRLMACSARNLQEQDSDHSALSLIPN